MRVGAIVREAWRNITSGTAHTALFAILLTAVSAGLVSAELLAVRAITTAAEGYRNAGASVTTIAAAGRVDGAACVALATVPGVHAAGAIRTRDEGLVASALPSSTIPVMEITQNFPALLHARTPTSAGVVLSEQAADTLGVHPGDLLVTDTGTTRVAGTYAYPADGRRAGYGYAALVPVPEDGEFDECWVDVWPASPQTRTLLHTTLTPGADDAEQPVLSQLNTTLGTRFDGDTRFTDRITRYGPLTAFALGAGLGYLAVRSRRIHHASALHAGTPKTALMAIITLETLSWAIPAAVVTVAAAAAFTTTGAPEDPTATILLTTRVGIPAISSPFLGAATALLLTKEHHLFRYFKNR